MIQTWQKKSQFTLFILGNSYLATPNSGKILKSMFRNKSYLILTENWRKYMYSQNDRITSDFCLFSTHKWKNLTTYFVHVGQKSRGEVQRRSTDIMSPHLNSVSLNEIKCRAAERKCSVQQQISLIHTQKEMTVDSKGITSSRKGFVLGGNSRETLKNQISSSKQQPWDAFLKSCRLKAFMFPDLFKQLSWNA